MKTNEIENPIHPRCPSVEEIAARAYQIYERAGRPKGRDLEHWLAAEVQLTAERAKPGRAVRTHPRGERAPASQRDLPPVAGSPVIRRNSRAPILLPPPPAN